MEYIFQNVNLYSINFINNRNDIKFEFLDSYIDSGKYCGELICEHVFSLVMDIDVSEDDEDRSFPQFVCDVSIEDSPKNSKHSLVKFQGSEYEISLVCKETKIVSLFDENGDLPKNNN